MTDGNVYDGDMSEILRRALSPLDLPARKGVEYPTDNPRLRLANALRMVLQHAATSTADDDVFVAAASAVEAAATTLEPGPHGRSYHGSAEGAVGGAHHGFVSHSPVTGPLNALAESVKLEIGETEVVAEVSYGDAYEGPPGHLHGGMVAAIFDEVLGFAQALSGNPGMTGKLEITYRAPTPLHTPLRVVGRYERTEGRKIFTHGTIHAGERLCAEARGLFISVAGATFSGLNEARERRAARDHD